MDLAWTVFLGLLALLWVIAAVTTARGLRQLPRLSRVEPPSSMACPQVSILVSARDEAAELPQAVASFLAQDYPHYEVVGVDDRSTDDTGRILDELAGCHPTLTAIHVKELPPGWLGKPHGLDAAYRHSSGEWLVFTDGDVVFKPDLLRRTLTLVQEKGWDHLTCFPRFEMGGFWEKTMLSVGLLFGQMALQPWRVNKAGSRLYVGFGAFQLVRREAYEKVGGHRRLAMEVVDDLKLGKLIKQGGFLSGVALGEDKLWLRYEQGVGNIVRGFTKNFFAGCGFRLSFLFALFLMTVCLFILPFAALAASSGLARWFAGIAALAALALHADVARSFRISPLYAFTQPLGAAINIYAMLRSAFLTLRRGGVVWRDTFYPLDEVKRGMV